MNKHEHPDSVLLQSFVDRLNRAHYDLVYTICGTAKEQTERLQEQQLLQTESLYLTHCEKLISDARHYVGVKKNHLIPYLITLSEKKAEGHDCRNCTGTGSCSLGHDTQLMELTQSHKHLKELITRLQTLALPVYAENDVPAQYKILQYQMALLECSLSALLLEEQSLVPKITEAQININARG